eukprot:Clim_evm12s210 gene=Clim_evmTU12s210
MDLSQEEKDDKVQQLLAIVSDYDIDIVRTMLESCNWDVERALDGLLSSNLGGSSSAPPPPVTTSTTMAPSDFTPMSVDSAAAEPPARNRAVVVQGLRDEPMILEVANDMKVRDLKIMIATMLDKPTTKPEDIDLFGWEASRQPTDVDTIRSILGNGEDPINLIGAEAGTSGNPINIDDDDDDDDDDHENDQAVDGGSDEALLQNVAHHVEIINEYAAQPNARGQEGLELIELDLPGSSRLRDVYENVEQLTGIPINAQTYRGWQGQEPSIRTELYKLPGLPVQNNRRCLRLHLFAKEYWASSQIEQNGSSGYNLRPSNRSRDNYQELDMDYVSDDEEIELDEDDDYIVDDIDSGVGRSSSARDRDIESQMLIPPQVCAEDIVSVMFGERFTELYQNGEISNLHFNTGLLRDNLRSARANGKIVLVYLHNGIESRMETNVFCEHVLTAPEIIEEINLSFELWGWDMEDPMRVQEIQRIFTEQVGNGNIPTAVRSPALIALVKLHGKAMADVVGQVQDALTRTELHTELENIRSRALPIIAADQEEENRRKAEAQQRRQLQEQQDSEFHASLQADKEKEALKEKEAEEQRKKDEAEAAAARSREEHIAKLAEALPPEPEGNDAVVLNFQMPDRKRLQRKFSKTDPLSALKAYLASQGMHPEEFVMLTNFPKRTLTELDQDQSLEAVGLNRDMVLVRPIGD